MIVLSKWIQRDDGPPYGLTNYPALALDYFQASWQQADASNYSETARLAVAVSNPPQALLADWRYPKVSAYPYSLDDYRAGMMACLAAWRESWTVTAGSFTLPANPAAQANFTALVTLHQLAISAGAESANASTWIVDAAGAQHTMTIADLMTLMLAYGVAVQALQAAYYTATAAVAAAQEMADLDAVALPPA